jgi:hypothetical protein
MEQGTKQQTGGNLMKLNLKWKCLAAVGCMALALGLSGIAQAATKKPNILPCYMG